MNVFIGMETSGQLRRRFQQLGHFTISADILEAEDGSQYPEGREGVPSGGHIQDDVFKVLDYLWRKSLWPDLAIFHITCTYLTNSAAWAFNDPDYDRYPGVGFHQKVKPGTLTGGGKARGARDPIGGSAQSHRAPHSAEGHRESHWRNKHRHSQAFSSHPAVPVRGRCQQGNLPLVHRQGWRGVAGHGAPD